MKLNKNNLENLALMLTAVVLMMAITTLISADRYNDFFGKFTETYSLDLALSLIAGILSIFCLEMTKKRSRKRYIFISYSYADKEIAEKIISELNRHLKKTTKYRFEILTNDSVILGDNILEAIRIFLRKADEAIIFISPEYFESQWCIKEFNEIFSSKKRIIPLIMKSDLDLEKLPKDISYIKSLNMYECSSEEEFEKKIALLAKDIITRRTY